jgi:medium-chain acyl-[acyl-carrier-protein] hydrolase
MMYNEHYQSKGINLNSSIRIADAHDSWISYSNPNPQAKLKLFCFPYAGAGSSMYHSWAGHFPEIEICLVHLPGRDKRIKETLYTRLLPLIEELTDALIPQLNKPFAFFGHSMGALIAFETARQLRRHQRSQPIHLFISARHAPQRIDPYANLYHLPEQEFIDGTEELFGALPEVVKQDQEVLDLFMSIMRADLTMVGTHSYIHEHPLSCPISVFGGTKDHSVTEQDLEAWREQTTSSFNLQMLPGDHFFIQSSRSAFLAYIKKTLSSLL